MCNFRAPYLSSITHHYNLGVGIRASEPGSVERLCQTVASLTQGLTPNSESASPVEREITQRCQAPLCNFRAPYLSSITHHYNLGVGIRASQPGSVERLCQTVEQMVSLSAEERAQIYGTRRQQMLADKIDYAKFLTWFIEHYPASVAQSKQADAAFWERFKFTHGDRPFV